MEPIKLSYLSGKSSQPLIGMTIGELFDKACDNYADQDALISVFKIND